MARRHQLPRQSVTVPPRRGEPGKAGTIRIAPDLNAALASAAKGAGLSATRLADQLLRNALDAGGVPTTPGGRRVPKTPAKPTTESLTGAGTRRTSKDAGSGCRHPIGRRIGSQCAACGATVKAT